MWSLAWPWVLLALPLPILINRLLPEHAALLIHAKAGAEGLYAISVDDLSA